MSNHLEQVRAFMESFGQSLPKTPISTTHSKITNDWSDLSYLRYDLIEEELNELHSALTDDNITEVADALADIIYVTYGAALAFGIPINEIMDEVHRSNMSKLGLDGKPIYREDGKVLKGPNYSPPDIARIIHLHQKGLG